MESWVRDLCIGDCICVDRLDPATDTPFVSPALIVGLTLTSVDCRWFQPTNANLEIPVQMLTTTTDWNVSRALVRANLRYLSSDDRNTLMPNYGYALMHWDSTKDQSDKGGAKSDLTLHQEACPTNQMKHQPDDDFVLGSPSRRMEAK
jgi:hypothetical protein